MWPLIRHMPISKEDLVLSVMEELIMPHWRTIMSPLWGADVTHKSACEWQAESLGESTWGWGYCHVRTRYWQHWWHPCYHYNMPNHSFSRNDCRNWSVLQQSGFLSSAFLFNIPPGKDRWRSPLPWMSWFIICPLLWSTFWGWRSPSTPAMVLLAFRPRHQDTLSQLRDHAHSEVPSTKNPTLQGGRSGNRRERGVTDVCTTIGYDPACAHLFEGSMVCLKIQGFLAIGKMI